MQEHGKVICKFQFYSSIILRRFTLQAYSVGARLSLTTHKYTIEIRVLISRHIAYETPKKSQLRHLYHSLPNILSIISKNSKLSLHTNKYFTNIQGEYII